MKKRAILVAAGIVAAGVAAVVAATSMTKESASTEQPKTSQTVAAAEPAADKASMPVAGSVVFIDGNGNRVQPTQKQLEELRNNTKKGTRSMGGDPTVVAVDPNDPSKGVKMTNIPPAAAAARINADGKLEAQCFDNAAEAKKFMEGAEVNGHSHENEAAK